jgi:hypothetical protein
MRRSLLPACLGLAVMVGCAPPPLDGSEDGPSIAFLFPTSDLDGPVCASFFVAVDIDGYTLVDPGTTSGAEDGVGHWHLDDDITGDYYRMVDPYLRVEADLGGQTTRAYRMTATLVTNEHSALSTAEFPSAEATVEFEVSSEDGCLAGASSDLSSQ